jgi:hypothetical protein
MKTAIIEIPEELDERLRHEADRRGISVAELVVDVLSQRYGSRKRTFHSKGIGDSGEGDLSVRVEEILAEEWEQHIDPCGYRGSRRSG